MGHVAPARLGPYRPVRELARGGMGVVYEAEHEATGARHAVKVLLPAALGGPSEQDLHRFRREVEALGRLDHPHVVRVHAADLQGPAPWLAQDLLPGGSLQGRLEREGPLAVAEAVAIARDLALALAHAHERGVLHRDVKPHNVLFDELGAARLVDFGLARRLDGASRLTATGALLGTPAYMAPEQVEAAHGADERTDVYGLGATLWAMLTGRPPFEGASVWATVEQVLKGRVAPPSRHRQGVPDWLDQVVLRAMARDPAERYASAAELARALAGSAASPSGRDRRRWVAVGALCVGAVTLALSLAVVGAGEPAPPAVTSEAAAPPPVPPGPPTPSAPWDPPPDVPPALVPVGEREWRHRREGSTFVWVPPATIVRDGRAVPVAGFFIGKHEVTFGQLRAFLRESGQSDVWVPTCPDDEAAHSLSWTDANAYCRHHLVRLPAEDEWLLAAFGTDDRPAPWGDAPTTPARANICFDDDCASGRPSSRHGSHHPRPPGRPAGASPFGCLDMIGNVAEWLADALPGGKRSIRGGGSGSHVKTSWRREERTESTGDRAGDRGLRVALSPRHR